MKKIFVMIIGYFLFLHPMFIWADPVSQGGIYSDARGKFLVTQGLTGANLVAGKQVLFRIYFPVGVQSKQIKRVTYHIEDSTGMITQMMLSGNQLLFEKSIGGGESVGVIIPGTEFPKSGQYQIDFSIADAGGKNILFQIHKTSLSFLSTKDIRFHVVLMTHPGVFIANQHWYEKVEHAIRRLGTMLPVRDGVSLLNMDTSAGVRYIISECNGWSSSFYPDCAFGKTKSINKTPGDHIDITIIYRPGLYDTDPPGDPGPGGNSAPYEGSPRAACVAGKWGGVEVTAACFAQEVGHNFGLEPPESPHYQDVRDPDHSKDGPIRDPLAFDFIKQAHYVDGPHRFLGDVMNNLAGGWAQGDDSASYNSFDWNYLQKEMMKLSSTGSDINPRSTLCVKTDKTCSIPEIKNILAPDPLIQKPIVKQKEEGISKWENFKKWVKIKIRRQSK